MKLATKKPDPLLLEFPDLQQVFILIKPHHKPRELGDYNIIEAVGHFVMELFGLFQQSYVIFVYFFAAVAETNGSRIQLIQHSPLY